MPKFSFLETHLEKHYRFDHEEERSIIADYTGGSGSNGMDDIVKKHKTPFSFTVHTGLSGDAVQDLHDTNQLKHGNTLHLPRFTSTSLDKNIAKQFAHHDHDGLKHIITIHVPRGAHGAYVNHHSARIGEEKEFVIPRGAKIKLHSHTKHGAIINWHAELMHDGTRKL